MTNHVWSPITDLATDSSSLASPGLAELRALWREQRHRMNEAQITAFLEKLRRELAIETGIIERLYTIDRGVTQLLIEKGIDEVHIPHGATDRPASEVVAMIRDHDRAIDSIFAFVAGGQPLSKGYVRELHKVLTAHQREVDAVDMEGNPIRVTLLRGEWKKWPNNPTRRQTGWLHEYCPPEQVDSEVDRLITWHRTHCERGVPPEVEAAWLHHRFTQIHPFQDGNGRVARCLATMVLLKGEGFPLVLTRDDRSDYVTALEMADAGDLVPLIKLFVLKQRSAFRRALGLSEAILTEHRQVGAILESARKTLRQRQAAQVAAFENVFAIADALHRLLVQRLEEIARELADVVKEENPGYSARSTHAAHGSERDHYHRFQIVQNARKVGYYANSNLYRAWAAVIIQTSVRTELLFSIHAPTHEPRGLLACAAMAYQRVRDEKDETRVDDVQPLHAELFEFTYLEEVESVKARFRTWLEECLVAGLEYWRRDL